MNKFLEKTWEMNVLKIQNKENVGDGTLVLDRIYRSTKNLYLMILIFHLIKVEE
jgi:hypothetical protein